MSGRVGYNNVVTDGLILYLDAGNKASYPGSGTTWTDLVDKKTYSTVNGVSWLNENGGCFSLSSGRYMVGPAPRINRTNMTFCAWVLINSLNSNNGNFIFGFNDVPEWYFVMGAEGGQLTGKVGLFSTKWSQSNTGVSTNIWYNVAATFQPNQTKIYINGSLDSTDNTVGSSINGSIPGNDLHIGIRYPGTNNWSADEKVSKLTMYNRTLTESEVLQNYNALKGRFGL